MTDADLRKKEERFKYVKTFRGKHTNTLVT